VVLPAGSFAEKDGSFTNTERRVQRVRQAVEPPGEAQADWRIVCQLARRMGAPGFDFKSPKEVMDEVNALAPIYGGMSFTCLEKGGLQWPLPHTGAPRHAHTARRKIQPRPRPLRAAGLPAAGRSA
jgi:predicted molibdopterin-dependent oxidoreductase YjgC